MNGKCFENAKNHSEKKNENPKARYFLFYDYQKREKRKREKFLPSRRNSCCNRRLTSVYRIWWVPLWSRFERSDICTLQSFSASPTPAHVENQRQLIRRTPPNRLCFGQRRPGRRVRAATKKPLWTYHHDFTGRTNGSFIGDPETRRRRRRTRVKLSSRNLYRSSSIGGLLFIFFQTKDWRNFGYNKRNDGAQQQKREGWQTADGRNSWSARRAYTGWGDSVCYSLRTTMNDARAAVQQLKPICRPLIAFYRSNVVLRSYRVCVWERVRLVRVISKLFFFACVRNTLPHTRELLFF